jgi:aspartate racemase
MQTSSAHTSPATLGILGGMGPAAGVDLCQKIVARHAAGRDQDHIPFILYSVPQIPDRTEALLHRGASPLGGMLDGVHALEHSGATCIAIACNTAHAWLAALRAQTPLPVLDVVDAVAGKLAEVAPAPAPIGLLATEGTHHADIYRPRLEALGYRFVAALDPVAHQVAVNEGIRLTKAGDPRGGGEMLAYAMEQLLGAGAQHVILGCTEIPVALTACNSPLVRFGLDASAALADACIAWSMAHQLSDACNA